MKYVFSKISVSLLANCAEASPAHRSADPEPQVLASRRCKHPGVRPSWNDALSTEKRALSTEKL